MRRLLPFALAGLLGLTLVPGLASVEALDWREARDAQVTRESTLGKEWLTPLYAHEPFFEKPLLAYAPELIAQRVLARVAPVRAEHATDVATSRAVRAALAAVLALLVAVIGTRAFGARAGWLAGCALASSVGLPLAARADGGQLLATLCAWLGIGALLEVLQGRSRSPDFTRFVAWFAFGAAALAAGPLGAFWPLGGIALYFALARSRSAWSDVRPGSGALIVLALALPWYGVMATFHRGEFLSRVPWFPYATDPRTSWLAGPLVALSYPMVLGFPWSPLLAASLRDTAQRLRRGGTGDLRDSGHAASLLLALLVAAAVPIALVPHAPLTAALPALPALALLCGRFLDRVLDGDVDARLLTGAARLAAVLGTAMALLAVLIASRIEAGAPALRLLGATLLVTSCVPWLADFAGKRKLAAALFALPVAFGTPIVTTRVLPSLEPWLDTRDVAEAVELAAPPRAPLVLLEPAPPSLRLMLPRNFVLVHDLSSAGRALAGRDGRVYVAFPPEREHDAARTARAPLEILLRSPKLVLARVDAEPLR